MGTDFDTAWTSSLRSLPKGACPLARRELRDWKIALRATKPAFKSAYDGNDPKGGRASLALMEERGRLAEPAPWLAA